MCLCLPYLYVTLFLFQGLSFLKAVEEGCISLQEPDVIESEYKPGIDYDGPKRLGGEDKDTPMKDDYQF